MHSLAGFRIEDVAKRLEAVSHLVHQQSAGGIHHVDAVRSVRLHEFGLARQLGRRRHVRHHQKSGDVEAELPRLLHMLAGDVGFGAMRGDPYRAGAGVDRAIQILDRADAGDQQHRHLGSPDGAGHRGDPLDVGVRAGTVIEARPCQAVAMTDLDRVHAGGVEGFRNCHHLLDRITVADGVHAVP